MFSFLMIEKSKFVNDSLKMLLMNDGHKIVSWDTEEHIIQALEDKIVDIIVMDVNHPKISCLDLINKINQNPQYAQVNIIAILSKPYKETLIKLTNLGIDIIFTKPFRYRLLSEKIKSIGNRIIMNKMISEPEFMKIFLESSAKYLFQDKAIKFSFDSPFLKKDSISLHEKNIVYEFVNNQIRGTVTLGISSRMVQKLDKSDDKANIKDKSGMEFRFGQNLFDFVKATFLDKNIIQMDGMTIKVYNGKGVNLNHKFYSETITVPCNILEAGEQNKGDSHKIFFEFSVKINNDIDLIGADTLTSTQR